LGVRRSNGRRIISDSIQIKVQATGVCALVA